MSKLTIRIFDGSRALFVKPAEFLVTIQDGNQKQIIKDRYSKAEIEFDGLPFYDNFGDSYSVVVWTEGYRQAGFQPVKLSNAYATTLDVMLLAEDPSFSFVNARWAPVSQAYPFLGGDTDAVNAEARYEDLMDQQEKVVACFLNLCEAMSQIQLAQGTPLDYIKEIRWDMAPAQDRFFAYCDAALVDQIQVAAAHGLFARESLPAVLHPGATRSWKQVQFGEANVQLTFHETAPDQKVIGGVQCVTVEPDMDYYKDLAAHTLLEVVPNELTHTLTDPVEVYVLRWMAGRHAGVPEFAPLYTITG